MGCFQTQSDYVIFTDNSSKEYQDFADADLVNVDENLGVKYESSDILQDTILLLRFNCPDPSCDIACMGWADLYGHVSNAHHKVMWYVVEPLFFPMELVFKEAVS